MQSTVVDTLEWATWRIEYMNTHRKKYKRNRKCPVFNDYIYWVYKTFLILSCTPSPLLPWEQPQSIRAWTLQGVESIPQGCWSMLTPMLPTDVSSWLDVLWVVDHSWYTQETQLSQGLKILLYLVSSTSSTLIDVDLTSNINNGW